jgi:hypothetical protein
MRGAEMEGPAMAETAERLRGELSDVLELIRRAGGGVVFEEFPGDREENALGPAEADAGRASEAARDASCGAQRMLIDEANRLAETLDQIRHGEHGISDETRRAGRGAAARPTECARSAPSRALMAPHGTQVGSCRPPFRDRNGFASPAA